jgi:hypothetical protein
LRGGDRWRNNSEEAAMKVPKWLDWAGMVAALTGCTGVDASDTRQTSTELADVAEPLSSLLQLPADPIVDPPIDGPTVNI